MTILWVSGKDQLWEMASDVNVEAGERKVAQLAVVIEEDAAQSKIQWLIDKGLVVKLHNTSFVDQSWIFEDKLGETFYCPSEQLRWTRRGSIGRTLCHSPGLCSAGGPWKMAQISVPISFGVKKIILRQKVDDMDESGWNWMKMDENGWTWMKMDETGWNGWKWMKLDESGWKWIKVDEKILGATCISDANFNIEGQVWRVQERNAHNCKKLHLVVLSVCTVDFYGFWKGNMLKRHLLWFSFQEPTKHATDSRRIWTQIEKVS